MEELQSSLHSIDTKQQQSTGLFCEAGLDREDKGHGAVLEAQEVAGWCVPGASKPCPLEAGPESHDTGKDLSNNSHSRLERKGSSRVLKHRTWELNRDEGSDGLKVTKKCVLRGALDV